MEKRTLHFSLPHVPEQRGLLLHANLRDYALLPHSPATRLRAGQQPTEAFGSPPPPDLTHYIDQLELPGTRPSLLYVTAPALTAAHGQPARQLLAMKIHVPAAGRAAARARHEAERAEAAAAAEDDAGELPDFRRYRLRRTTGPTLRTANQSHLDTAIALLFKHPELLNLSQENEGEVPAYILDIIEDAIGYDGMVLPDTIGKLGAAWKKSVPVLDEPGPDGARRQMTTPGENPGDPPVLLFSDELVPAVKAALVGPLRLALKEVKDCQFLRGQQWTVQPGTVGQEQPERHATGEAMLRATGASHAFKWSLSNLTPSAGLAIDPRVRYESAPRSAEGRWQAEGLWYDEQQPAATRLTPELAASFAAGRLVLLIVTASYPQGLFRVPLVPAAAPHGTGSTVEVNQKSTAGQPDAAVQARFELSEDRTALTWRCQGQGLGDNASAALHLRTDDGSTRPVYDLDLRNECNDQYDGTLHVTCTNHWLRHLGAYVQFLDGAGQPMTPPDWDDQLPGWVPNAFQRNKTKKFLDILPPVNMMCGIPVQSDPIVLRIPIPKGAQAIRLLTGGLGTGEYDEDVCGAGVLMTACMELALPLLVLTLGSAIADSAVVNRIIKNKPVFYSILAVGAGVVGAFTGKEINRRGNSEIPLLQVSNALGPLLLKTGLKKFIAQKATEGAAARAIPFVGLAFQVFGAVVTVASLAQTTVAILQSPFCYRTDIGRAIDLEVELTPDLRFHKFPSLARRYRVLVTYDKSATTQLMEGVLDGRPRSEPIRVLFRDVPGGGRLKVFVFMYAANGWQAGQGESGWLRAEGNADALLRVPDLRVTENAIPLTTASVYTHLAKLAYQHGRHVWLADALAPTATPATPTDARHQVLRHLSITLAQAPAALGYCWQATGLNLPRDTNPAGPPTNEALYALQSISILEDPERGYAAAPVGYSQPPGLLYDLGTSDEGEGRNFFIEGLPNGEFHLRRLRPAFDEVARQVVPPVFAAGSDESWGCFPVKLDRYVVHPQGWVLGLSYGTAKLFMCRLPAAARPNDEAPKASLASGEGVREGLLLNPSALAIGLDGAVLVLENQRVQAFDLHGNPVPYFRDPQQPDQKISTLALNQPKGTQYLDLAVEGKGYLYVLARQGAGRRPEDYRLTIYTPDGELLVTTPRMAADKLTVGLDRSVYTLNYEVFEGPNGRTEPSISQWIPPAPAV
ncbi:hypothetical protein MON38_05885 [Hymenobacter sp. DH14]|uniref:Uncharacterized protein n=1 Tax=Hymenobacter cyanobacteriorum TaxID=2926463 RepID=A0A9X1VE01_9BACT|nr:hypothetical protein [Hymenobacter cyanobacteriorum]MCI1186942.1 hypothetical protein [Hymenobacter cyanobacteriorum]